MKLSDVFGSWFRRRKLQDSRQQTITRKSSLSLEQLEERSLFHIGFTQLLLPTLLPVDPFSQANLIKVLGSSGDGQSIVDGNETVDETTEAPNDDGNQTEEEQDPGKEDGGEGGVPVGDEGDGGIIGDNPTGDPINDPGIIIGPAPGPNDGSAPVDGVPDDSNGQTPMDPGSDGEDVVLPNPDDQAGAIGDGEPVLPPAGDGGGNDAGDGGDGENDGGFMGPVRDPLIIPGDQGGGTILPPSGGGTTLPPSGGGGGSTPTFPTGDSPSTPDDGAPESPPAGDSDPDVPENPPADGGDGNTGGDSGSGGGSGSDNTPPLVTLSAPEFVKLDTHFNIAIDVKAQDSFGVGKWLVVDVDFNHDGEFSGDDELAVWSFPEFSEGLNTFTISLAEGTYSMQARASDFHDNVGTSATITVQIDPNAGYVGSSYLQSFYDDYMYVRGLGDNPGDVGVPSLPGMGNSDDGSNRPQSKEELLAKYRFLMFDDQDRVQVSIRATLSSYLDQFKADLENELGFVTILVAADQNLINGWLPADNLMALTEMEAFSSITPIYRPVTRAGSVQTQGDAVMGGDVFRTATGMTGTGVKVGVLSDSVDKFGGGLADSQATGDLPNVVEVLLDGPDGSSDEGRAMLEIIHDVAPGAALAYHTALVGGPQGFADGIRALANAGSTIITDDVGYFVEPIFNDGVITRAIDEVTANGVFYTTAAGNQADVGFRSGWAQANGTIGTGGNTVSGNFLTFGGNDIFQNITLGTGALLQLIIQWDDAYLEGGSPQANFQVETDIDVYVVDLNNNNAILASATDDNATTDQAFELLAWVNTGASANIALAFHLRAGPPPTRLAWISLGDNPQAQAQGAPTMWGHVLGRTAVATGAVPYFDPTTPEPFTSLGGNLEIFFDADGNRLPTPEIRRKPDIAAPDHANTTFFIPGYDPENDGFPNFTGTSAATPHVAGAVALMISDALVRGFTPVPQLITQYLQETAIDVGAPGIDDLTGPGLIVIMPLPEDTGDGGGGGGGGGLGVPDEEFRNDTSDKATDLGVFQGTHSMERLTIRRHDDGLHDYDWFKFTAGISGTLTVNLNNIQTLNGGDLHFRIFKLVDGLLIELGSGRETGGADSQSASVQVNAGEQILVWVYGLGFEQGFYDLLLTLVDNDQDD